MQIRIFGAGLAGVSLAEALLQKGCQVFLCDVQKVAYGASGKATGLLHPFPGLRARIPWRGEEAFALARAQVNGIAKKHPSIRISQGIWRPALPAQWRDFQKAGEHPLGEWRDTSPEGENTPGLWISEGLVLDVAAYLEKWVEGLIERGVQWVSSDVSSSHDYEQNVWCTGIDARILVPELKPVRGQSIKVLYRKGLKKKRSFGLAGRATVAFLEEGFLAGSTFERGNDSSEPELSFATTWMRPRMEELNLSFSEEEILEVRCGVRADTSDHLPIIDQLSSKEWVYTGLGSKGLLYHCLLARILAEAIVRQDVTRIPRELRRERFAFFQDGLP